MRKMRTMVFLGSRNSLTASMQKTVCALSLGPSGLCMTVSILFLFPLLLYIPCQFALLFCLSSYLAQFFFCFLDVIPLGRSSEYLSIHSAHAAQDRLPTRLHLAQVRHQAWVHSARRCARKLRLRRPRQPRDVAHNTPTFSNTAQTARRHPREGDRTGTGTFAP